MESGSVRYTTAHATPSTVRQEIKLLQERKQRNLNISTVQIDILGQHLTQQIERSAKRNLEQDHGEFLKDVSVGETRPKVESNIQRLEERRNRLRETHKALYGSDSKDASLARKSQNRIFELQIKYVEEVLEKQKLKLQSITKEESDAREIERIEGELFDHKSPRAQSKLESPEELFGSLKGQPEKAKTKVKALDGSTDISAVRGVVEKPSAPKIDTSAEKQRILNTCIAMVKTIKKDYENDLSASATRSWSQAGGYFQYLMGGKKNRLDQLEILQDIAAKIGSHRLDVRDQNLVLLGALLDYRELLKAERWDSSQATSAIKVVNQKIDSMSTLMQELYGEKTKLHQEAINDYRTFIHDVGLKNITNVKNDDAINKMSRKEGTMELEEPSKQRRP